jgi:hypothetical protein
MVADALEVVDDRGAASRPAPAARRMWDGWPLPGCGGGGGGRDAAVGLV